MGSIVGGWRNWCAVEGIDQLDRLAYVEFFFNTQPARNLCATYAIYTTCDFTNLSTTLIKILKSFNFSSIIALIMLIHV